uniref:Uncharacterized protein n=1 Tax=Tetradesmus obliquus TaxID=3088 RepID=A0A383VKY6_TETOB|eukprot:jgi/Sobl393_1/1464/SZX66195.1
MPEQHHRLLLRELGVGGLAQGVLPRLTTACVNDIGAAMVALRHHMNLTAAVRDAAAGGGSSSSSGASSLTPSLAAAAAAATGRLQLQCCGGRSAADAAAGRVAAGSLVARRAW